MLRDYRRLFRPEGALRLASTKAVGRLSAASWPLALLFLVRAETGQNALAGLALGASGLGGFVGNSLSGRLIDRFGQTRVLMSLVAVFAALLVTLAELPHLGAPAWGYVALAFLAAVCEPPLGSSMRMIWDAMHEGLAAKTAAAFETVVTEALWVIGPLIVTACLAFWNAQLALLISAATAVVGVFGYALAPQVRQWHSQPAPTADAPRVWSDRRLLRVFLVIGLWAAGYELVVVSLPQLLARHGSAHQAGLVVALISLGTICGGVLYGARLIGTAHERHDVAVSLLAYGACLTLIAFAPGLPGIALFAFLAGATGSAVLTLCYLWGGGLAPEGAIAQTYTAVYAALVLGGAVGGASGGLVLDHLGLKYPFVIAGGLHLVGAALAFRAHPAEGLELPEEYAERVLV
jgi:predicted MFS family arabinose efflux permease